jgi:hypothetical protein
MGKEITAPGLQESRETREGRGQDAAETRSIGAGTLKHPPAAGCCFRGSHSSLHTSESDMMAIGHGATVPRHTHTHLDTQELGWM